MTGTAPAPALAVVAPDADPVADFLAARAALNRSLSLQGEVDVAAGYNGRWYTRAKNALISDVLRNGPVVTPTHRYDVRWDGAFRRWKLVVTPFILLMPGVRAGVGRAG